MWREGGSDSLTTTKPVSRRGSGGERVKARGRRRGRASHRPAWAAGAWGPGAWHPRGGDWACHRRHSGWGQRVPSPSEVSASRFPLSLRAEGRPGLGRSPGLSGQSALCPWTLEWLRPRQGNRPAQVAQHTEAFIQAPMLLWVPPRHGRALKKQRGTKEALAPGSPGKPESGRGCGAESICFFLQPGWMEGLGIFQKEPS